MHLTLPCPELGASFIAALEEGFSFGDGKTKTALEIAAIEAGLEPYLALLNAQGGTVTLPNGTEVERAPHSQLWLTDGAEFLGVFSIRYRLSARMGFAAVTSATRSVRLDRGRGWQPWGSG